MNFNSNKKIFEENQQLLKFALKNTDLLLNLIESCPEEKESIIYGHELDELNLKIGSIPLFSLNKNSSDYSILKETIISIKHKLESLLNSNQLNFSNNVCSG